MANLANVPPGAASAGFTISTECSVDYFRNRMKFPASLKKGTWKPPWPKRKN